MRLLINHPSDLFQGEASYYVKPKSVKLYILIPMAPTNSPLCLLKFQPFSLPFTNTNSLLPDPDSSLLSLSRGSKTRLHIKISPASMTGCKKASSLYLCK
jgi:hypothetical protein